VAKQSTSGLLALFIVVFYNKSVTLVATNVCAHILKDDADTTLHFSIVYQRN